MVNKIRKLDYIKYSVAFIITLFVFTIGIFVGDALNNAKLSQLQDLNEDIMMTTLAMQTQYDLVAENPCSVVNDTEIFKELLDVSLKVEYMENQLGQENAQVKRLKEYYSTLLIKNWIFTQEIQETCEGNNIDYIIYFYSSEKDCPYCESQGYILTNIRKDYDEVRVFPFDYRIDNPALRTLKTMFVDNVDKFPILIINGETHQGFMSRVSIEKELEKNN